MDMMNKLVEVDTTLEQVLRTQSAEEIRLFVRGVLEEATARPGRTSKLHADFLLSRMADIARDLLEAPDTGMGARYMAVMGWIDRGITHTAYLANPDSSGRFLEAFDQTVVRVGVPDPKDPSIRREREEKAKELKGRFEAARSEIQTRGPKKGGLIITPGM